MLEPGQLEALRRAAAALAAQDGGGVPREVLVGLAGPGLAMTVHGDAEPVVAVVHANGGRAAAFAALTPREREVAALLAAGHTNAEIAQRLVIAVGTVKDHVHSILGKTGLRGRAAVAAAWHGRS
jgi:DNA-binding NarL/FixJ family response regulator